MNYSISRFEKNLDHDGNIVSIFLAVSCTDGTDSSYFEHWLTEEEKTAVLADETALKPILEKCYAECALKMENEVATRPQPTIMMTEEKKITLEKLPKAAAIATAKAEIITDRAVKEVEPVEEQVEEVIS